MNKIRNTSQEIFEEMGFNSKTVITRDEFRMYLSKVLLSARGFDNLTGTHLEFYDRVIDKVCLEVPDKFPITELNNYILKAKIGERLKVVKEELRKEILEKNAKEEL